MKSIPSQYHAALRLESLLGDPGNAANVISFPHAIADDEAEAFPAAAMARLQHLGVHRAFVPRPWGGEFTNCETLVALARVVARRDLTVAVSYSTLLWTVLAWLGGSPAQQRRIARAVLNDGQFPCLAYSEEAHGADLVANETQVHRDVAGVLRLNGTKWPINRATRSEWIVLLARHQAESHLRNQSLFLIEKAALEPGRFTHLPAMKTHGLRGCDISGLRFQDCPLPSESKIGADGAGIELAQKGFQITRTFCTGLSLGVADTGLRLTAEFARTRQLYGQPIAALPHCRATLADAFLSLLISECVSIVSARALQLFPAQFSAWSSVAKVQVTRLTDFSLQQLAGILGARSYLREQPEVGIFQKFLRDGAIVSVFDGNNIVCLDRLASLLPALCRRQAAPPDPDRLVALFDLRRPLPPVDFGAFTVWGRTPDVIFQSLPELRRRLATRPAPVDADATLWPRLQDAADQLELAVGALREAVARTPRLPGQPNSAARFALAERFCSLHSAISSLGIWLYNQETVGGWLARPEWLLGALQRQGDWTFRCGDLPVDITEALCDELFAATEARRMYSLLPWPLAPAGQSEPGPEHTLWKNCE